MSNNSAISWCDATWNPVVGCTKASEGCRNCYAIREAHRMAWNPNAKISSVYRGLIEKWADGSLNWTGEVRCLPERLGLPLTWKKPKRIFVNSVSDLFHESVPGRFIGQVFGVMAVARQHTFQLLTKRPQRMLDLMHPDIVGIVQSEATQTAYELLRDRGQVKGHANTFSLEWPLPNVHIGVSAENQQQADYRIPLLLQTPAAVRFVSLEPLLDWVDLVRAVNQCNWLDAASVNSLDWVIVGCESGPCARPMPEDWVRQIRDECQTAGVALFYKQAMRGGKLVHMPELDGRVWAEFPEVGRCLDYVRQQREVQS